MKRTLLSLSAFACVIVAIPAHADFSKAERKGNVRLGCAAGSFLDPRNGGECWSCPKGYDRTVYPVTSGNACQRPATFSYHDADKESAWGCDKDKREFFDPRKGGECWRCPEGYRRTAEPVTSSKACAKGVWPNEKLSDADYRHKFQSCPGRAFFDPRNGGECWSCPKGYDRTLEPVTSDKACSHRRSEDFEKATKVSSTCPAGSFADPNGGCYACPTSTPLRSIHPVTSDKACASSLREAFVPDLAQGQEMCRVVVAALDKSLKEGEKAKEQLMAAVKPLIEPIRKPLEEKVDAVIDRVASRRELGELLDDVTEPVEPYLEDTANFAAQVDAKRSALRDILLDPNVVCSGDAKKMLDAFKKPLSALRGKHFVTVALSASFKHPLYVPRVNVGLTFATNLDTKGGLYFDIGLGAAAPADPSPVTVSLSGAVHPKRKLADFALSAVPETAFSFGKGGAWDEAVKKLPPLKAFAAVDSIDVAWDFDTSHIPAIGVSKELYSARPGDRGLFSATGSVGWGIPIVVYDM